MIYPVYVKNCIEALEAAGYSAYAVGGAVRDGLLELLPSDWDITTSARPEEILKVFENEHTIPTGIKHGTITVVVDGDEGDRVPVEITTYRIDGEYKDSRHPESVEFSRDVLDDLSRRDFTVNAMAFNEKTGIVDAFGGKNDLDLKIIRAVGDPEKRFSEDALRILRAFRFSAQLGFEIEERTFKGAIACSHLIKNIARERIGVEFKKMLSHDGTVYALKKLIEGDIWSDIFSMPAPEIETVESFERLESKNCFVRLSVLLGATDEKERNAFLDSLRLSNGEKRFVLRLCTVRSFDAAGNDANVVARRFLHLFESIEELATHLLLYYHPDKMDLINVIKEEGKKQRPLSISSIKINGSDLVPLCKGDYRRVGLLLNELLSKVIDDPSLNDREILLEIAKKSLE